MRAFDVIIVGAGPVGLSLALSLKGLSVCLIHQEPLPIFSSLEFDPRLYALNQNSLELLADLGVPLHNASPYQAMEIWDQQGASEICFNAAEMGVSYLGKMLPHSSLVAALSHCVVAHDFIQTVPDEVIDSPAPGTVRLRSGLMLSAQVIIAADGDHSVLAEAAVGPIERKNYGHRAMVGTVRCEKPHKSTAYQVFGRHGPCALLPMSDANHCSFVWSLPEGEAKDLDDCDAQSFATAMRNTLGNRLGELTCVGARRSFALSTKHVLRYGSKQCMVVGDAAHRIHPLAGLGLNMGFLDVIHLSATLHNAAKVNRPLGSEVVIRRYTRAIYPQHALTLKMVDLIKEGWESQNSWVLSLRNKGMRWLHHSPLKSLMLSYAQGLSFEKPRSLDRDIG